MGSSGAKLKIAAVCCTFNRPVFLGRMIRCFELQDYEDRELIILDDAGQYGNREGDRWRIVSTDLRYPSLGEKRNEVLRLVSDDVDAVATWDDDDRYLHWQLSACVAALGSKWWAQPRQVLNEIHPGRFTRIETFNRKEPGEFGYPGGWCFERNIIKSVGGYPPISNGEDADLAERLTVEWGPSADTITAEHPTPGYVFTPPNRSDGYHISAMGPGNDGYEQLGQIPIESVGELDISWPSDYTTWPIEPGVRRRCW